MAANEIRDTPGRLLFAWSVLLTCLVILAWRIHLHPADYEWTEYPTALGDKNYYTRLGQEDRYAPNLHFTGRKGGLYRRSEEAETFDDASMLKLDLDESGRHFIYHKAEDFGRKDGPLYLKCGENRYIEFGTRKHYPPFVPLRP